jgi:DNA-binding MarR family transcriptional regulator
MPRPRKCPVKAPCEDVGSDAWGLWGALGEGAPHDGEPLLASAGPSTNVCRCARPPQGVRTRPSPEPSELAQTAQVSKQTVGSVVDQLERAGYVKRIPDPTDARARLVLVTDLGRQLVESTLPVVREIERAWQVHLGAARTRELRRSLEALREITDPFAVDRPSPHAASR